MRPVPQTTLTTRRLILRPYLPSDLDAMVALETDPEVMRFVGDGPMSAAQSKRLFDKVFKLYNDGTAWGIWAVCDREDGRVLGGAEIKPCQDPTLRRAWEIVYLLGKDCWGQGLATELCAELVRFAFEELGIDWVVATIDYENAASIRVVEKIGMRFWKELRDDEGSFTAYGIARDGQIPEGLQDDDGPWGELDTGEDDDLDDLDL